MRDLQVGLATTLTAFNDLLPPRVDGLWLCSAYASPAGVEAVRPALTASAQKWATIGVTEQTDPASLRLLHAAGARVRLAGCADEGLFHPKCYVARSGGGTVVAAVGSANLTGGGAGGNAELLVTLRGTRDHPVMADLVAYQEEVFAAGAPLTGELLAVLDQAYQAYGAARAQVTAGLMLPVVAGGQSLATRVRRAGFLAYVRDTPITASYKAVILGLLLQAPHGRLALQELARRFRQFYLNLADAGYPPERQHGHAPPVMARVRTLALHEVVGVLLDEPRKAFRSSGVVQFDPPGGVTEVRIARTLWLALTPADRECAGAEIVARLSDYYRQRVGVTVDPGPALRAAGVG